MKNIKHYRFSKEFNEICKPIFAATPITFCSIGRLFLDGTYTSFMSDPNWRDLYLKKHYLSTLHHWLEGELSLRESGFGIWSMSTTFTRNENLKALQLDCAAFNYHNGINMVDTYPNYIEMVRFSSPKKEGIESYFLERLEDLRRFALFIKEKIESNKILADEFNAHLPLPVPLAHEVLNQATNQNDTNLDVQKYYIGHPLKERLYLTKQEIRCLIPYLLGLQKRDIAKKYGISVRTVEKHIEQIREKSVCKQMSLLRPLFLNNKYISALIPNIFQKFTT